MIRITMWSLTNLNDKKDMEELNKMDVRRLSSFYIPNYSFIIFSPSIVGGISLKHKPGYIVNENLIPVQRENNKVQIWYFCANQKGISNL